ncbi:TIR domain-containing protein [Roseibium sp.]|uniref:TIR domain-containing protein n=1 Tax=Roseibium sp. TaxID=1936156 RepID=UPI003BAAE94F
MPRRCFFSFHYQNDNWRASQIRNIGRIESNRPATDNDWEQVRRGGQQAIRYWIDSQLIGRSCTIVLVGEQTANRPWINYEIIESWNRGMGVVGINIHGLQDMTTRYSRIGLNPFDYVFFANQTPMSRVVPRFDPPGLESRARYGWIQRNLTEIVEDAIAIRQRYP